MGYLLSFFVLTELRDGGRRRARRYNHLVKLLLLCIGLAIVVSA